MDAVGEQVGEVGHRLLGGGEAVGLNVGGHHRGGDVDGHHDRARRPGHLDRPGRSGQGEHHGAGRSQHGQGGKVAAKTGPVGRDDVEEVEVREPDGVAGPVPLGDDVADGQSGHNEEEPEPGGLSEGHRVPPLRLGVAR